MESLVNSFVSTVLQTLFNMAKEELAMQLELEDNVKTLQATLEKVQFFVQEFEKKNTNIELGFTENWLNKINQDIYDIEDLLEQYGALKDNDSKSSCFPVEWLVSGVKKVASYHWIGVELQRLGKKLNDNINDQKLNANVICNTAPRGSVGTQTTSNHMTNYEIVRSDIVGNRIHDDARRLIELLIKEDGRDNPLVYAIVGIGGLGKTTLAKLVFDDHTIANSFQVKVWVSVNKNFNESDILKKIKIFAGRDGKSFQHLNHFDEFKNIVNGKKLFMVLDDTWEAERVWNGFFRDLLTIYTAKGSRVLVTTRNEEVGRRMMAVHSQDVEPLPVADGWSLLCKSAFPTWLQQEAKDDKWKLKDIGIDLVNKCTGLPLAIKALGGMLSTQKKTRESWELVRKSSIWEVQGLPQEIHSALYISYQDLPSNIKRCFLYCSLFPRDGYFNIMKAKNLWIQEGLIKDEKNISLHDVADSYFTMLVRRNFVILDQIYIEPGYFTMHDLFYSLSLFLTQNENIVATKEEDIFKFGFDGKIKKLRRLSIIGGPDRKININYKFLQEQTSLRTLLISDKNIGNVENALFNHLRHLRTLWLQGTDVTKLPKSLGSLKLLRYLNLSHTLINELPKTIQNLNALRILDVSGCKNLNNLPSSIMKLHHLCSLTTKDSALDHLPPGVGNLNKLQHLEFIMPLEDTTRESSTIKELETLTELRILSLSKLERVLDRSEAKSADLKGKRHLKELELSCSLSGSNEVLKEGSNRIEDVFEDLCPPNELKTIKIYNYFGCKLPSWLESTSNNVKYLKLTRCSNCTKFDGLGLLPNLEALYVESASSIKSIDPEFYYGNNMENGACQNYGFFPRMKLLSFEKMDSWEQWNSLGKAKPVMTHLETLQIVACPKLKSFPEELLYHSASSLKRIIIREAAQLVLKEVHNLPSLEIIEIGNIPYLERISRLPALQHILIEDCPGVNLVELTHTLKSIEWKNFNADSLPLWISNNLKATYLRIRCKKELVCFRNENGAHERSKIEQFDNITVWDEKEYLTLTYTKTPFSFSCKCHGQQKEEDFFRSINEEVKKILSRQAFSWHVLLFSCIVFVFLLPKILPWIN